MYVATVSLQPARSITIAPTMFRVMQESAREPTAEGPPRQQRPIELKRPAGNCSRRALAASLLVGLGLFVVPTQHLADQSAWTESQAATETPLHCPVASRQRLHVRNLPQRMATFSLQEVSRDFDVRRHRALQLLLEIGLSAIGTLPSTAERSS